MSDALTDSIEDLQQALRQRFHGVSARVPLGTDTTLAWMKLLPSKAHPDGRRALVILPQGKEVVVAPLEYRISASKRLKKLVAKLEETQRLFAEEMPRTIERFDAMTAQLLGDD